MQIRKFKCLSDGQISNIENQLEVRFPEDYKKFLREIGGGVVEKDELNQIAISEIGENISIDVLYGDDREYERGSILFWMDHFKGELLDDAVIIGDDLLQGFLVMICDGENRGIYYWDDAYNFESSDDRNNMYRLAESFEGLVRQIST